MLRHRVLCTCLSILTLASSLSGAPKKVLFSQSGETVEAYDFVEVSAKVEGPDASNPFTDVKLSAGGGLAHSPILRSQIFRSWNPRARRSRRAHQPE